MPMKVLRTAVSDDATNGSGLGGLGGAVPRRGAAGGGCRGRAAALFPHGAVAETAAGGLGQHLAGAVITIQGLVIDQLCMFRGQRTAGSVLSIECADLRACSHLPANFPLPPVPPLPPPITNPYL